MPRAWNDALGCEKVAQSNAVAVRHLPTEQARWGRAALGAQGSHQAASHRDELGGDFLVAAMLLCAHRVSAVPSGFMPSLVVA